MYNNQEIYEQLARQQQVEMMWYQYFSVLIGQCKRLRLPTSMIDAALFLEIEI